MSSPLTPISPARNLHFQFVMAETPLAKYFPCAQMSKPPGLRGAGLGWFPYCGLGWDGVSMKQPSGSGGTRGSACVTPPVPPGVCAGLLDGQQLLSTSLFAPAIH